ncbi:MAG: DUF6577 family protein [Anaerolineae bacterium]
MESLPAYLSNRLDTLQETFGHRAFTVDEAQQILATSRSFTYKILQELTDRGQLKRLGRGVYTCNGMVSGMSHDIAFSGPMRDVHSTLFSEGIHFFVTGLDILLPFTHHLLVRYPHLIYVERGSGEWAKQTISSAGYKAVLGPDAEALEVALDLVGDEGLIVIRETGEFYGTGDEQATLERALVDLYCEVTRLGFPLSLAEVGRIFFSAVHQGGLNYSRLLHAARRRGLEAEIRGVLLELSFHVQIPALFLSGKVKRNENTAVVAETIGAILR